MERAGWELKRVAGGHHLLRRLGASRSRRCFAPAQGHPGRNAVQHLAAGRVEVDRPAAIGGAMEYLVVVHRDRPGGPCGVTVPDLPGCFSGGDTLAEALANTREAIVVYVEDVLESAEPVPEPSSEVDRTAGSSPPSRSMTACWATRRRGERHTARTACSPWSARRLFPRAPSPDCASIANRL